MISIIDTRGYGKITKLNLWFQNNKISAFICGLFFKICHFIFRQTLKKRIHDLEVFKKETERVLIIDGEPDPIELDRLHAGHPGVVILIDNIAKRLESLKGLAAPSDSPTIVLSLGTPKLSGVGKSINDHMIVFK